MKKKIILDIIMSVLFVTLMKISFTGILIHELIGLFICFLFTVHKIFNYNWIKNVFLKIFTKKFNGRTITNVVIDLLILIDVLVILITGIFISRNFFGIFANLQNPLLVSALHHSSAYIGLILISIHIGMHLDMMFAFFKKLINVRKTKKIVNVILSFVSVLIILYGIISFYSLDIIGRILEPFNVNINNQIDDTSKITTDNKIKIASSKGASEIVVAAASETISLDEYLSKIICTGCNRRCPLIAPQCVIGQRQAVEKTTEYNSLYGDTNTDNTDIQTPNTNTTENETTNEQTNEDYGVVPINEIPVIKEVALNQITAVMGLFILGTYYIVVLAKKEK